MDKARRWLARMSRLATVTPGMHFRAKEACTQAAPRTHPFRCRTLYPYHATGVIFGPTTACIPFSDHNHAPRNIYQGTSRG